MFQFQYFHIPKTLSRDYCDRALQALQKVIPLPQQGTIHLIAIDSAEMAWMNEQYRGKEGPTDILTFSYLIKDKRAKIKEQRGGFVSVILGQVNPLRSLRLGGKSIAQTRMSRDERDPGIQANKLSRSESLNSSGLDSSAAADGNDEEVVGEIYLCLEKIKIYAKESGRTYKEQLEYIVIHGLVHLMGYDHEMEGDSKKMEKVEAEIMNLLT